MIRSQENAFVRALILDIDGTLLRGEEPIPGLEALFAYLKADHLPYVIASNNSTKTPEAYQQKLAGFGVVIEPEFVITSGVATAEYARRRFNQGSSLYVIGETGLRGALMEAGYNLVEGASDSVEAVVVGGDSNLTYQKLKIATLLLQKGAELIGTNPDVVYPTHEGLIPETGTTLAALTAATAAVPTIIGKPERYLFDAALGRLSCLATETAVVGDRLDTDIIGGQRAGLQTILTTTGVDNERSIREKGIQPDWVVNGLNELVNFLRGER
jgi:4-nitrophenyl phosphatase